MTSFVQKIFLEENSFSAEVSSQIVEVCHTATQLVPKLLAAHSDLDFEEEGQAARLCAAVLIGGGLVFAASRKSNSKRSVDEALKFVLDGIAAIAAEFGEIQLATTKVEGTA